ncbi:MAG: HlyC/CorC family transporter [Acidobacteria bacterium]|nr:HlyC/CorC family transporter [Acidobacteriota bacterium]
MEIQIVVAVILLLLLVFLATIDLAFAYLSDVALRRLVSDIEAADKPSSAALLRDILDDRPRFRFTLSSALQITLIAFIVLITLILLEALPERTTFLVAFIFGALAAVFGRQILPRLIVRHETEKKLLALLPAVRPIFVIGNWLTAPFSFRTARDDSKIEMSVTPDSPGDDSDNADELNALIEVGEAEGIIEEKDRELIETMIEFSDTIASDIMTPRTEIVAIRNDATIREARDLMIEEKYSRLPVYRDSIDNILGMIYVRDLLHAWAEGMEQMPVSHVLRPTLFVPETKPADELLKILQLNHSQIAVVIDEYGGVAGLISVEDIIEEIVGEIEDEDIQPEEIVEIIEGEDGYFDILGSTEIDKIERLFDLELEDEDFTTIAGLVTHDLGYVPKIGEKLTLRGLEIEVKRADEKRINLLRIRPADTEQGAEENN